MGYLWPVPSTDWVSCSWQCHRDRNPPSSEAGTGIGCGYGAQVVAPDNGVVTYVKTSNSNATGRVVEYRLDDGRDSRTLHMSEIWVAVGQRVTRGQVLGLSGASGFGDDWYYGPHAHQTLWPGHAWGADTINFELYVGSSPSPTPGPSDPTEDDMAFTIYQNGGRIMILGPETFLEIGAELTKKTGVDGAEALGLYQSLPGTKTVSLNTRDYDILRIHTRASG